VVKSIVAGKYRQCILWRVPVRAVKKNSNLYNR